MFSDLTDKKPVFNLFMMNANSMNVVTSVAQLSIDLLIFYRESIQILSDHLGYAISKHMIHNSP